MKGLDQHSWILSTNASVNLTRASYGGLLRMSSSEAVFAFVGHMEDKLVLWLELHALWRGLILVCTRYTENIIVHMDSKLAVDIIQGVIRCPWKVMSLVLRIKTVMMDFRRV